MTATSGSHEQAFLSRICASPLDDEPRLAYAAWLRARGDPRGDFIHAQCVFQRGDDVAPEERRRLCELIRQLLQAHEQTWTRDVCEILGTTNQPNYYPARFDRGFIDSLIVRADVFAASADRLLAAVPLLRKVEFARPVQGRLDERLAGAVAARPELAALQSVRLFCLELEDDAVTAFVRSPYLGALRELDLGANSLGPASVEALLAAPFAANLPLLDFWSNQIGDAGACLIAAGAPHRATKLRLAENGIGVKGALALAGSQRLGSLEFLELTRNPIGDDGACAIVASPSLGALREMDLFEVGLSYEGICRLVQLPGFARLESLAVGGNGFGDPGVRALAESPNVRLVRLDLEDSNIGDEGAKAIGEARSFDHLVALGLRYNEITDAGARALAASRLPNLADVDLAYNDIASEHRVLTDRFPDVNLVGQGLR